jgi:hypothetical protein
MRQYGSHADCRAAGVSDETGKQFYQRMVKEIGSQKAASEHLDQLGIPGIRYLDGHSRYKGEGHYNYVVFDDRNIGDASPPESRAVARLS